MAILTLRSTKGTPLTNNEIDTNFTNLNLELATKLDTAAYTASDILTKLKTVDGIASGLDADLLDGMNTSSTNMGSTVVVRDASGSFSASMIISNLIGNVTGNVTGNVSGTAGSISGIVAVGNGGTGASSIAAAQNNLQVDPAGTALALSIALG